MSEPARRYPFMQVDDIETDKVGGDAVTVLGGTLSSGAVGSNVAALSGRARAASQEKYPRLPCRPLSPIVSE